MTQSTQKQLRFHPSNSKTIRVDFNGGELPSDFGALLLRETILHSGLISRLTHAIDDKRHPSYMGVALLIRQAKPEKTGFLVGGIKEKEAILW